uniref:G-protein coupled receptors family 1 profile domain-containing protein n=1 Tax=Acrobeloides nanus TaxID=290746 RepID=A0A914DMH9_9BILA
MPNGIMTNITRYNNYLFQTDCFKNYSTTETAEEIQQRIQNELNLVYDTYYGWLALPLASIALIITIIFIISIFRAIRQHRVSRKSYVLLLNRSIGDLLVCTVAIFNGIYVLLEDDVNRDIVQAVDSFFAASYWAAMVSYVSLSLLKLYAVARPFDYRRNVNMKRCIHLMIISWIIFAFIAVFSLSFMALVKIGFLREWSGCRTETCLRPMFRIRNFFTVSVYLFTIICFLLTEDLLAPFISGIEMMREKFSDIDFHFGN